MLRCVWAPRISISIKILGYEDIEENSGCRYLLEQSEEAKTTLKPSTGHKDGTRAEFLAPKLINLDLLAFSIFCMTRQLAHLCWGLRGRRWWWWPAVAASEIQSATLLSAIVQYPISYVSNFMSYILYHRPPCSRLLFDTFGNRALW